MDRIINLSVTVEEANKIMAGLGELPYKYVKDLVIKLQVQAAPQINVSQEPKAE